MQSSEFLCNTRDIPTKDSRYYDQFWDNERKKCDEGLTVNGVYIHPWLYWHTNLWNIEINRPPDPKTGLIRRDIKLSNFRDNEWIIAEALAEAERTRKGVMFFGSRRLGKSEFISSYSGRSSTLYKNTENVVMGGNWDDIDIIMAKIVIGLDNLPEDFRFGRIAEDLRKHIHLGFKDKKNKRLLWSKIVCRNHNNGINTEAPAGLTPTTFIMDEVGKSPFAQVFEAAKPSFTSEYGWRCVPIFTGTSGDLKPGSDAQKFFENPAAYNFIVRELPEEGGKKVSVFISGLYRMEGKVETTFGDYIVNKQGILLPKESELFAIPFKETDPAKAKAIIDEERLQASKSPDPTALLKATMYYPLNTRELFLRDDGNNFPIEAINDQIAYLLANPQLQGRPARVYRDVDGKAMLSYDTNKKPIIDYPLKATAEGVIKDAAIVIYEPPIPSPPYYLYIAGADPYNVSQTITSASLGSFYIYKRLYDPVGGTFQRRIVAEYTGRPRTQKEFYEICEMLLEIYNAVVLPENAPGNTFVNHFDLKNKGHMIASTYDLLKEISPNTRIQNQPKGLPPTPAIQKHYKELVYQYLSEEIITGSRDDGTLIKKLGAIRIPSIGLLRELAAHDEEGNFDRYVAFGHTLEHELWADKMYPFIESRPVEEKEESKVKEVRINSPFNLKAGNPFGMGAKNPFGIK